MRQGAARAARPYTGRRTQCEPKTLLPKFLNGSLPADAGRWKRAAAHAAHLRQAGFTGVWLPPAYKGAAGRNDVGYGVYDLYDLGEFDQKGQRPHQVWHKRGIPCAPVRALQGQGLAVLADVVLNHRMGADACEQVDAEACDPGDRRRETGPEAPISAWTKFTFPGRGGKYSAFQWNHTHFDGVDWDDRARKKGVFQFEGKSWNAESTAKTATTIT